MEKIRSKSWVGNIYHKFEAVCQEVDEFVTKDTVKYVENQVQTVGANMKKLYSGVVQDFLIPMDDHVKREAPAVNGKPNSIESHNALISTEHDGEIASEQAEIDFSVGNECATATCKNSHKVFKENITREEALVDEESSTSEDRISSESCSDKDCKDTMCYSFSDDDKCFSDISSSQIILEDDIVREEQPLAKGSSSFLDNLSKSQLKASKNDQTFDSSPDDINCISNVFSVEESHGNSIMTKFPHPTSLYDTELGTFLEDERGCNRFSDAAEIISGVTISQMILQVNITSEDQLAPKESSSARDKSLPQTPAFASDIPPTSRNDARFEVSLAVRKSFLDDVTCVSEKSSTACTFEDTPSTFQSTELVLSRVQGNEIMDVDTGISNSSLLVESSILSTSSIGNCTLEAESDFSISIVLSSSLSTPLVSTKNIVDVVPALSNAAPFTNFSDDVNASSSYESVGNAGPVHDLERCPSPQLKVLMCPAEIGCMNDSYIDLPGMETIDLTDKGKRKESCVLIDNKLHSRVSFRPRKYKSYKELIQEAFASRKKLIKEYKQLAVLYADVDAETSQHTELSQLPSLPSPCLHSTESSTCNICESEWELL